MSLGLLACLGIRVWSSDTLFSVSPSVFEFWPGLAVILMHILDTFWASLFMILIVDW